MSRRNLPPRYAVPAGMGLDHSHGRACATLLVALLAVSTGIDRAAASACHEEADRLADRHQLAAAPPDASPSALARAELLLDGAREADDDGIVEGCLRQLAEARSLIETDGTDHRRDQ